jgi:hypothetical protein
MCKTSHNRLIDILATWLWTGVGWLEGPPGVGLDRVSGNKVVTQPHVGRGGRKCSQIAM